MKKSKKLHISAFIKREIKVEKSKKAIFIRNNISLDSYSHKLHTPWIWNSYDDVPLWSSKLCTQILRFAQNDIREI